MIALGLSRYQTLSQVRQSLVASNPAVSGKIRGVRRSESWGYSTGDYFAVGCATGSEAEWAVAARDLPSGVSLNEIFGRIGQQEWILTSQK